MPKSYRPPFGDGSVALLSSCGGHETVCGGLIVGRGDLGCEREEAGDQASISDATATAPEAAADGESSQVLGGVKMPTHWWLRGRAPRREQGASGAGRCYRAGCSDACVCARARAWTTPPRGGLFDRARTSAKQQIMYIVYLPWFWSQEGTDRMWGAADRLDQQVISSIRTLYCVYTVRMHP